MEKTHKISELIQRVEESNRQAAMRQYMDGKAHLAFQLSYILADLLKDASDALAKGQIQPRFDALVNAAAFHALLVNEPVISYNSCDLPLVPSPEDEDDAEPFDTPIDAATFDALNALSDADLLEHLSFDYGCDTFTIHHTHTDDAKIRQAAYENLLAYFRAATRHAASLGSDSARMWLEAVRLLTPNIVAQAPACDLVQKLEFAPEDVDRAYACAQSAQAQLWVDAELAKLGGK